MTVQRGVHPSADVLRAFGLGKLDDSSSGVVMDHLDQCEECRKEVAALTNDDFLNRLRQARNRDSTATPAKTLNEAARSPQSPPGPTTLFNVPPELADHPDYEVLRELGRGGMGVVYLARHRLSGRLEVLKVMNKSLLGQPDSKERFLREIQSAARLDHKNVVKMHTALERGELMVLVMEYVPGEDLAQVVKERGPLPVLNACYYVQQAASGLQHAFEKGMIHRDIKPQNMILARAGKKHTVKVLDFGLAKATRGDDVDAGLTTRGAMMGTPGYMSPEQSLDAATVDIRADIYSLGCTLYYLLSGKPPFSGRSAFEIVQAHHATEAQPLNLVRPEVPEALASVVGKMMAKDASQRYQTPKEVVQALEPFVKGTLKPLPQPPALPQEEWRDAATPPVIPKTVIEGPVTIAKGRLKPLPPRPVPAKRGQRTADAPPLIQETMIEGDATIARELRRENTKWSWKWMVVPLVVVLLLLLFIVPALIHGGKPVDKEALAKKKLQLDKLKMEIEIKKAELDRQAKEAAGLREKIEEIMRARKEDDERSQGERRRLRECEDEERRAQLRKMFAREREQREKERQEMERPLKEKLEEANRKLEETKRSLKASEQKQQAIIQQPPPGVYYPP